jgi:cobalamin biosynthesis protein CbiG
VTDPTSPGRVVTLSVTATGAALAERLPFPHRHGDIAAQVTALWDQVDGLVLVCASGIAVRVVGPLLADKQRDPAVVCIDDQGRWAIALAGGHHGANTLARQVAALVGAEPVVTTATDGAGLPGLDTLPRYTAEGDIPTVTRAWLDGTPPTLTVDREALPHWPTPAALDSLEPARTSMSAGSTRSTGPSPDGSTWRLLPTESEAAGAAPGSAGPATPAGATRPTGPGESGAVVRSAGSTQLPVPRGTEGPGVAPGSTGTAVLAAPTVPAGQHEPAPPAGAARPAGRGESAAWVGPAGPAEPLEAESAVAAGSKGSPGRSGSVNRPGRSLTVVISDRVLRDESEPGLVVLRPESLVVGVGSSSGADPEGIAELVDGALRDAGLSPASVGLVASVDLKQDEPGIVALAERFGVGVGAPPAPPRGGPPGAHPPPRGGAGGGAPPAGGG